MAKHPGKTKAQRDVLDQIGVGVHSPRATRKTLDALLAGGLIVECGRRVLGRDAFGEIALTEYEMPTPIHIQWCESFAAEPLPTPYLKESEI